MGVLCKQGRYDVTRVHGRRLSGMNISACCNVAWLGCMLLSCLCRSVSDCPCPAGRLHCAAVSSQQWYSGPAKGEVQHPLLVVVDCRLSRAVLSSHYSTHMAKARMAPGEPLHCAVTSPRRVVATL